MNETDVNEAAVDVAAAVSPDQDQAAQMNQAAEMNAEQAQEEQGEDLWAQALAEQTAAGETAGEGAPAVQVQTFPAIAAAPDGVPASATTSTTTSATARAEKNAPLALTDLDVIADIPVQLSVELGRTRMTIKQLLQLGRGSVIELDSLAGQPMDIYINGYLIAQGEVVVVDERYGIRLTDIITPAERLGRLNGRR